MMIICNRNILCVRSLSCFVGLFLVFLICNFPSVDSTLASSSSSLPLPYYDLSCPFEMSKYSCFHHDVNSTGAANSKDYYQKMHTTPINTFINDSLLLNRRIFLVGDSLMRQLFIAIGCLSFSNIEYSKVDWMTGRGGWPCHNTLNCVSKGQHSGFNVGYIKWKHGGEIYFKPTGGCLDNDEPDIVSRFLREIHANKTISLSSSLAVPIVPNEHHVMTKDDILVMNIGIHDQGNITAMEYNVKSLAEVGRALVNYHNTSTPLFIYITTPSQHFASNGLYIHDTHKHISTCSNHITSNIRQDLEVQYIIQKETVHGVLTFNDTYLGSLHIGPHDCTHYCMPGLHDILAENLFRYLARVIKQN